MEILGGTLGALPAIRIVTLRWWLRLTTHPHTTHVATQLIHFWWRRSGVSRLGRGWPLLLLLLDASTTSPIDVLPIAKEDVCRLHRHTAEVRYQMRTVGVTCDVAFGAFASVLATQRKHITAVTAPICTDVGDRLESVRDAMVNFFGVVVLKEG